MPPDGYDGFALKDELAQVYLNAVLRECHDRERLATVRKERRQLEDRCAALRREEEELEKGLRNGLLSYL